MITSIHFQNFKALRDATLPLGPFTIIVGPNGSGKSTAMEALRFAASPSGDEYKRKKIGTAGLPSTAAIEVIIDWVFNGVPAKMSSGRYENDNGSFNLQSGGPDSYALIWKSLPSFRVFSFDARALAAAVDTTPLPKLGQDGSMLAAVLDALRDSDPERFDELNRELNRWLPEFDRILFETPQKGKKSFLVRTTIGHHRLAASDLSQGVLFALAFLTLAYLPEPPSIVCFEEPDRGIHPRLLVDIRDAMYRLAFPEKYGEKRDPVQVIATTHSPYLLDLYKDHPEQIVIAHKDEQGAHFERLSEKPHLNEILEGAPLGEIWYSGILGGVPRTP